jgi:hypothetical protein
MKSLLSPSILACITLLYSCSDKDAGTPLETIPSYNITGHIESVTKTPLQQVDVKFFKAGQTEMVASTKTNADGVFAISLETGTYTTEVSVSGYTKYTHAIQVSDTTRDLNIALLGAASVSGNLISSQTAKGLANAKILFERDYSGSRISSNEIEGVEFVAITDESGHYNLSGIPSGNFVASVAAEGFFVRENLQITLTEKTEVPNVIVVANVLPGELRVVLSWNKYPNDLDLNLAAPDNAGGIFEVFFGDKNPNPSASLDVDVIKGFGPETMTIHDLLPGTYKFNVINYDSGFLNMDAARRLSNSPAKLEIYDENGLIQTLISPPLTSDDGNAWQAFEIVVTDNDYTINVINNYFVLIWCWNGQWDPNYTPPTGRMMVKK